MSSKTQPQGPVRLGRISSATLVTLSAFGAFSAYAQTQAPAPTALTALTAPAPEAAASAASYAVPTEHAGIFKKVHGQVSVKKAGEAGAGRKVASGDALGVGERVHAGKDSGSSFTLSDGTELVLGPRSSVAVRDYSYDSTTQEGNILLDFIGGQLRVISGLISKKNPEKLKVHTPTAVVGVRGTDFIVEAPDVDE